MGCLYGIEAIERNSNLTFVYSLVKKFLNHLTLDVVVTGAIFSDLKMKNFPKGSRE